MNDKSRTDNSIRNVISGIGSQVFILIITFLSRTLFIKRKGLPPYCKPLKKQQNCLNIFTLKTSLYWHNTLLNIILYLKLLHSTMIFV